MNAFGSKGSDGTTSNILKGLEWAGKANANIVNMSFAGPADGEMQLMLTALQKKGAVLIAAAGNAGPNAKPLYPAAYPDVIAVTATDAEDKVFKQANRGKHIAVSAPGVAILAAAPGASYQMQSGTSFAAAQVSGIAALLLERNPKLDAAAIRRILMSTARDLGTPGHDDQFGSGLADAFGAVESGCAEIKRGLKRGCADATREPEPRASAARLMIKRSIQEVRSARLPHSTCASVRLARSDGPRPGGLSFRAPAHHSPQVLLDVPARLWL